MANPVLANRLAQVGFIVRDVEATKIKFAEFFGVPVPPTCDGGKYEVTGTMVNGEPAPDANCLMAFFDLENIQLELIQPNGVKSTWQDFLYKPGVGIPELAVPDKSTDAIIKSAEKFGGVCVQRGKYGGGNGEYAYIDFTKDLKCLMETLESY